MKFPFARRGRRSRNASLIWLARLQRGLRDGEGAEFVDWLKRTGNRSSIVRDAVEWYPPEVLELLSEIFHTARFVPRPAARRSPIVGAGALLAASLVVAAPIVVVQRAMKSMSSSYMTGPGAGRRMALQDGTPVMLNAATKIVVSFSEQLRFVNVVYGEASFAVRPDSNRPFRVRAAGRDLVANLSVLDVRLQGAKSAAVTVLSGTVWISPDTSVGPLESLQIGPDVQSAQAISATQAQARFAWQRSL